MIESKPEARELGHLSLVDPANTVVPSDPTAPHSSDPTAAPLASSQARNIQGDLDQLDRVCARYLEEVESVRVYYIEVANRVARMVDDVGMQEVLLPGN